MKEDYCIEIVDHLLHSLLHCCWSRQTNPSCCRNSFEIFLQRCVLYLQSNETNNHPCYHSNLQATCADVVTNFAVDPPLFSFAAAARALTQTRRLASVSGKRAVPRAEGCQTARRPWLKADQYSFRRRLTWKNKFTP